ncbi:MAG TPA: TetR family transcriptional regulator [Solirubrobacteraceae bacterium]|nr:TetR family transcriptional regulator [Solirubrobacteraceae bacterium]
MKLVDARLVEAELVEAPGPSCTPYQKLCPHPNGLSHEQVAAHQRKRLSRAIVESVDRYGYDATTVGRLCGVAGVSKRAFYELFTGKPDCFALAYEQIVCAAVRQAAAAQRARPRGRDALGAAIASLLEAAAKAPEAASFVLIHALGSTPVALRRSEWAASSIETVIVGCLEHDRPPLSPALRRGILAGIIGVAQARLIEGRAEELPLLAGELLEWAWACVRAVTRYGLGSPRPRLAQSEHPEVRLARPRTNAHRRRLDCCRWAAAVDSTVSAPPNGMPAALVDGAGLRDEHARVLRSAIALAAHEGVSALTVEALALDAGVPTRRVCSAFESAEECLLEALNAASERLLDKALSAGAAVGWAQGGTACAALSLLVSLAGEPDLARVAFVEALGVGPAAIRQRVSLCSGSAPRLVSASGSACPAKRSPVAFEAGVGAVWGLVERHVSLGATERLPRLLAPACLLMGMPTIGIPETRTRPVVGRMPRHRREVISPNASVMASSTS